MNYITPYLKELKSNMKDLITKKLFEMVEGKSETQNYMFFNNLKTIHEAIGNMLKMEPNQVDQLLSDGHNWALDHISTAADDIEEVYHFLSATIGDKTNSKIDSKDLKMSENNRIFVQKEDMIEPTTKPEVKPQTKPATTPEPKPSRKNKPFLPNVTPGIKTQPKAVTEAIKNYEIYHKTLNSAISQIEKYAMARGFDPIEFGMFDVQHVGYGETKRINMPLTINGAPTKKMINAQIYRMDNGTYELNMYIG